MSNQTQFSTVSTVLQGMATRHVQAHPLHAYSPEDYEMARQKHMKQYATCQPDCPLCGGSGYIRADVPITDARFGKLQPCPNMYQVNLRNSATRYGLTAAEIEALAWSDVSPINDGPAAVEIVKEILSAGFGFLYLWGDHGQAKTLILKIAVAISLRQFNRQAAYVNMTDLLSDLRTAYDANDPNIEATRRLEFWRSIPVLAIDEFNRVNETEFVREKRFALIDTRNVQAIRQETITLISSNTPPDQQESYLTSRFNDGRFHVLALSGQDARPWMNQNTIV